MSEQKAAYLLQHVQDDLSLMKSHYDKVKFSDEHYALCLMNIKNFRYYNTLYGNAQGNELLLKVQKTLAKNLSADEFMIHKYADNFLFLLHYQNEEHVHQRMFDIIDSCYRIDDPRIFRNIFYSFGLYFIHPDAVSFYTAITYANIARKGTEDIEQRCSSYEFYDQSYYDTYMNRINLEEKTAHAYKNYEFIPFIQPKVDPMTGNIIAAEALLRWFDEDGNMIPVSQFLPILNKNAYISLIDLDIFEIVCKFLRENLDTNKSVVPVSFNISKTAFYEEDALQAYIAICEKYQIPRNLIEFELMESISLDDTQRMKEFIHDLKEAGFHCSLDDFGSGYSSFNVLLNAELDTVKMDRQFFLKNLNGDSKLVIKTVINLIKSLNMLVVAEGVETKEHIDFLKECNCDMVQGFYYYKPMSLDNFNNLLQEQVV